MMPSPGFSTLTPIPGPNELPPITTSAFTAITLEHTPLTHHDSTSANPNPMISPAFVEANYEILESLLRERRKHIHNEDLRAKLEYFSEEYEEEREMEPRLVRTRKLLSFSIQEALSLLLTWEGISPLTILGLQEDQRISRFIHGIRTRNLVEKNRDRFSHYHGSNHGLLSNLSKTLREILAKEKLAKIFEQPLRMLRNKRLHDMSKYCHFHEDHGYDTNDCHKLRHQIEEAVKSVQLSYLIKGIKKGIAAKASDTQRGEWKKGDKDTTPAEDPILMIS
ncbi:hypothetical protein Tco_1085111 [Tanacetum coccineum]